MEDTLEIQDVNLKQLVRKAKEERKLITEVIEGCKQVGNYDEQLLIRDEATGLRRQSYSQPDRQIGRPLLKLPDKGVAHEEDPCCAVCVIF